MRSSDEVLAIVERHGEAFSMWHSWAALRAISEAGVSEQAAKSPAMEQLIALLENALKREDIWKTDVTRFIPLTCTSVGKLKRHVPGIERIESTAAEAACQHIRRIRPADISFLVSLPAFQKAEVLNRIVPSIQMRLRMYSPSMLANMTWQLARAGIDDHPDLLTSMADSFARKIDLAWPNSVVRMVESFAMLGKRHDELFEAASKYAVENIGRFERPSLYSPMAWAYNSLGIRDEALMTALAKATTWNLESLRPSDLSTLVFSFAKNNLQGDAVSRLLPRAAKVVAQRIMEYKPPDLYQVVWGYATLNATDDDMLEAAARQARATMDSFNHNGLSGMLWGFATLQYKDTELMQAAAERVMAELKQYTADEVGYVLWSFAALKVIHPELYQALGDVAAERIGDFSQPSLDMLVWSFADRRVKHPKFFDAISRRVKAHPEELRPISISFLSWACAALRYTDDELMKVLSSRALPMIEDFGPQELANLAWGFGQMSIDEKPLVIKIAEVAMMKAERLKAIDWNTILAAARRLSIPSRDLFLPGAPKLLAIKDWSRVRSVESVLGFIETVPEEDRPVGLYEKVHAELKRRKEAMAARNSGGRRSSRT